MQRHMDAPQLLLALIIGLLFPLLLSNLPPLWVVFLPFVVLVGIWRFRPQPRLLMLVVGLCWSSIFHHGQLEQRLPKDLDGKRISVTATVHGLPEVTSTGSRFELREARVDDTHLSLPDIRASWYGGPPVTAGERWRFDMRLRRPSGMANPGGYDYESGLYAQGIGAAGSIRSGELLKRFSVGPPLGAWRGMIRQRLINVLGEESAAGRLVALVVGDKTALTKRDWEVLQATGTSHLLVISGLHIGMLGAAVFGLITFVGRAGLFPWPWPRLWLGVPAAVLISVLYAWLAGFGVPVQRALLMISLALLTQVLYRRPGLWTLWLLAFAAVVAINPAAPLRAGFWLSFVAVGLLLYGMGARIGRGGLWWRWGRAQWVVFVGLWPWLMFWGMPVSVTAPLVNVVAIPWVSLLVVPAALLGTLLELLFGWPSLLLFAAMCLDGLFQSLEWVAQLRGSELLPRPDRMAFGLALVGVAALLGPLSRVLWAPGLVCLLALWQPAQPRPEPGQLWITVLDVGQGLSVLLQTHRHNLLYDTGARYSSGFDVGEAVVFPALLSMGVRKLDVLLLSHADNDHAGGAPYIAANMQVDKILAGQYADIPPELKAQPCRPGAVWNWDGVEFEIIHSPPATGSPNDQSCVLRARNGEQAVLLPGDVSKKGEYQMLTKELSADVLLAPHHGSHTSSSYAFIRRVAPRWVVFSAGRYSQYGHPHPSVVQRYRELHIEPVYTASAGAIRFVLDDTGKSRHDWSWRARAGRFWHEDWNMGQTTDER